MIRWKCMKESGKTYNKTKKENCYKFINVNIDKQLQILYRVRATIYVYVFPLCSVCKSMEAYIFHVIYFKTCLLQLYRKKDIVMMYK